MSEIIAVCNLKGGVGKTTTVNAFADDLSKRGFKVLCIDLDPQPGNLSLSLGADKDSCVGSYEILSARAQQLTEADPADFIQSTGFCDVIAANRDLALVEGLLASAPGKEGRLRTITERLRNNYDYILIDTPPSLGVLTLNAFAAADKVIIPTHADYYSVHGVVDLISTIRAFAVGINPALTVAGIIVTQYRPNTNLQKAADDAIKDIAGHLDARVFATQVRQCVAVQEAQFSKVALSAHKPSSTGASDYHSIVDEYLKTEGR
jgi:chromosome partitioning protein